MRKPLVVLIIVGGLSLAISLFLTFDPGGLNAQTEWATETIPLSSIPASTTLTSTLYLPAVAKMTIQYVLWSGSGHADKTAGAFTHWDGEVPPEVPTTCARCHSTDGFLDFLGEDGSAAGTVDNPAPAGSVIECEACHNPAAESMSSVHFPSGNTLLNLGAEAHCMQCHQGRNSTAGVNDTIANAGVADDETTFDISFRNPHYYPAGATLYGTEVRGAYEYSGQSYDGKYQHVVGYADCVTCHDAHGLTVVVDACDDCHTGVQSQADLDDIRWSITDFDGDGNRSEGIAKEIDSMAEALLAAIQVYAKNTLGNSICYDPGRFPYYFIDANDNGHCDSGEEDSYIPWSPRLLRATYNYQWVQNDPGAYAHNPPYILQILYDSLDDVGADVSKMHRP